jgi:integrase/recombinase XerD
MVYGDDRVQCTKLYTELEPKSRHAAGCPHRNKGPNYLLCDCPKWAYGVLAGKPYRRALSTRRLDRAMERIRRIERLPDQIARELANERVTTATAIERYLTDCRTRHLAESTIRSYSTVLLALQRDFSELLDITTSGLDRFRAARKNRRGEPISATCQRKELEHLRAFFSFCQGRQWIATNPAKALRPPRCETAPTQPYDPSEVPRLLAASWQLSNNFPRDIERTRARAHALQLVLLYTGLRISDVARLRRSSFDPRTKYITLRVLKNGAPIRVRAPEDLIKALDTLPRESEYWFHSGAAAFATTERSLQRTLAAIGRLTQIHCHPHRYRDTFASQMLTNGADIRTVQMALGHSSVRITEKHYAHFVVAHQHLLDAATSTLQFTDKAPAPLVMVSRQH